MNTPELAAKYLELFGQPSRSRNKNHLRRRLSWRLQEMAEGGLAPRALELITALGDELPERWRQRMAQEPQQPALRRDPRLPPLGTQLSRVYRGAVHTVTICEDGIEYKGKRYRSLSAAARQITGTTWNGFSFFGVAQATKGSP